MVHELHKRLVPLRGLFAQKRNLLRPRFWAMLRDLARFYREAPGDGAAAGLQPLGEYLASRGYSDAFRDDHLLPMAAAIWSASPGKVADYPTEAFLRFCENHHLLQVSGRFGDLLRPPVAIQRQQATTQPRVVLQRLPSGTGNALPDRTLRLSWQCVGLQQFRNPH